MNSLRTARVLIVDDIAEEALPVIKVLGSLGIGCVYVSGKNLEELEEMRPLSGIRLAFVDMELESAGTSREILGKTVNVLRKVIAKDTAPLIFVAWTQHDHYVEEFTMMLGEAMPKMRPLFVHKMPKPFSTPKPGQEKRILTPQVISGVKGLLKDRSPLGVLWSWEQMCHDAATATVQSIADFATAVNSKVQPSPEWKSSLAEVLRFLSSGGAGRNEDETSVTHGLLEVLGSLHLDRLEHADGTEYRGEIKSLGKLNLPQLTAAEMAHLNSMLLIAPVEATDSKVRPGNVYVPVRKAGLGCPHARCKPSVIELGKNILNFNSDAAYKALYDKVNSKTENEQKALARRQLKNRLNVILRHCRIVLVEVTAACDYSQTKVAVSRFVAGLLVPDELVKLIKKKNDSTRSLEAVELPSISGTWHLVLSARFPYSIATPEKSIKAVPIFRLRNPILVDLQAWLAAQSARPGYVSLR